MARDVFETAHILVALGGDLNNTVPKRHVTAAEIAVLQVIHGNDAIVDIEPSGVVKRSMRTERARLDQVYSSADKQRMKTCPVAALYPGAAARLFQNIDELRLATVQFKPGLAPAGISEREEDELRAVQEGALLADGSVDEDKLEDMDSVDDRESGGDDDDLRGEGAPAADADALA